MFENFRPPEGYTFVCAPPDAAAPPAAGQITVTETGDALRFFMSAAPPCPTGEARALRLAAALCARNAIGGQTEIQWPGNIMLTGKCVCRTDCRRREDSMLFGFEIDPAALSGKDPETLLRDITYALAEMTAGCPDDLPVIIQRYCEHCVTLMKFVDVTYRGMPVYGFAFAVDKHGGLMVMTQDSRTVVTVYTGEAALAVSEPEAPDMPPAPRV